MGGLRVYITHLHATKVPPQRMIGTALKNGYQDSNSDREVVLSRVRQHGFVLQYASDEIKNDKEVVLTAVQQNGRALQSVCF
jgi:hypothetical protein